MRVVIYQRDTQKSHLRHFLVKQTQGRRWSAGVNIPELTMMITNFFPTACAFQWRKEKQKQEPRILRIESHDDTTCPFGVPL